MSAQIGQQQYYLERAAAARAMAAAAATPQIASIHRNLADRYEIAAAATSFVTGERPLGFSYDDFEERPAADRLEA